MVQKTEERAGGTFYLRHDIRRRLHEHRDRLQEKVRAATGGVGTEVTIQDVIEWLLNREQERAA